MAMMKFKPALIVCGFLFLLPFIFGAGCPNPCQNNPCDDGIYCNGVEVCTVDGNQAVCSDGSFPCEEGEECNEETDSCEAAACETDDDCDDDDLCTEDTCDNGMCVNSLVECPEGKSCDTDTGECVESVLLYGSSGCGLSSGFTTGERTIMSNSIERVYYLKLPENYDALTPYPLIFGFHGASGDYTSFTEGYYDFQSVVGEEAIMVFPNGLANEAGLTQWDHDNDLIFFDDLYHELETNLCFDTRKVFATGHSAGGGFTHTLGCKKGEVLRAIAPVAGSLLDYENCIGQVGVIQIHGSNDRTVPLGLIRPARDYWIAINSCNKGEPRDGVNPICEAYGGCDTGFPVEYCEHDGGHEWPDFSSDAIWDFFANLPPSAPSEETGSGNVDDLGKGSMSFKIHYPSDFEGTPEKLALALYPFNITPPISVAPSFILNSDVPLGDVVKGEVTEYNNVGTSVLGLDFGDYTLTVTIYVAGGSYPMPTHGKDYQGLQNITIDSNTIVVETPFELELVEMGF